MEKHYVKEVFSIWKEQELSFLTKFKITFRLFSGIAQGFPLALKKRKLFHFDNESNSGSIFKTFDSEGVREAIRSQPTLAGSEIRLCRFFWYNREYPEYELFQLYYNCDASGWSEENVKYAFYRKGEFVTFAIDVATSCKTLELRVDPCRGLGDLWIRSLELFVDETQIESDVQKVGVAEDMKLLESSASDGSKYECLSNDPRILINPIQNVASSFRVTVTLKYNP